MAQKVFDTTSASSDFYTLFDNLVATNPQLDKVITEVRNETNLFLVKVLRFYSTRDLAYVQEFNTNDKYLCHMTHEMLSYEVSLNCMCDGVVKHDVNYGTYIEPHSDIYGVVANVRFKGSTDEKCLLSCLNYNSDNSLMSNVRNGEIRLNVGESTLSLTRNRINLMTPTLIVNGLPYNEPKLANYYDKTEIGTIKSDTDAQINELNELIGRLDVGGISQSLNDLDSRLDDIEQVDIPNLENRIDNIEQSNIDLNDYDVDFTYSFGVGGIDDTITIHAFLERNNED